MHNTRWLVGLVLAVTSTLAACNTETSLGRDREDSGTQAADTGQKPQPETGCTYAPMSVDLSCNDDPNLPTVAGSCQPDGTCACRSGFVLDPTSKRCKLDATSDAGVVICTVGTDQTCNDDDLYSGTAGVCMKGGTCGCNSSFVINPATGRCRSEAKPDAAAALDTMVNKDTGANTDTGSVVVDAPVGKDLGKDSPGVCTFGMNQTCNDNPIYSWVAGTCQSNGTCVCNSGYVLNASGLCALAPRDAGPDIKTVCTRGSDQTCNDSPASATWGVCLANGTCSCTDNSIVNASTGKCMRPEISTCAGTYTACGCGCCTGVTPMVLCYYPSAGDSLTTIKSADEAVKNGTNCGMVGCFLGQRYLCCTEAAADPAGSATYSASYNVGGYDRIGLKKTGSDGNCMTLSLINPAPAGTSSKPLRVTVPSNWSLEGSITMNACGDAGSAEQAIGAQGTITFAPNGTSCSINAHLTVFYYADASGTLTTKRIDADNVPISGGGPSGYCK